MGGLAQTSSGSADFNRRKHADRAAGCRLAQAANFVTATSSRRVPKCANRIAAN